MQSGPLLILFLCVISASKTYAYNVQGSGDLESGDSSGFDGDLESGSGDLDSKEDSKEIARHPLEWIERSRTGDIIFADQFDIKDISEFVESSQTNHSICFTSQGSKVPNVDESVSTINSETKEREKRILKEPVVCVYEPYSRFDCQQHIKSSYQYPEYAVGLLDNGCTAFLIGPYHAMTSARCVYDNKLLLWEDRLDFWRGRNDSNYLQRLEWERVFISRSFYEKDNVNNVWAMITFKKSQLSTVWLPIGFCQRKFFGPTKDVTTYGYISSIGHSMLFSKCLAYKKHLYCWCYGPIMSYRFNGGPILNAYQDDSGLSSNGDQSPVFGLSVDYVPQSGSYSHKQMALSFDSDTFWSVCFLLRKNGFSADCQKLYDVPLGKKKKFHTYRKVLLGAE